MVDRRAGHQVVPGRGGLGERVSGRIHHRLGLHDAGGEARSRSEQVGRVVERTSTAGQRLRDGRPVRTADRRRRRQADHRGHTSAVDGRLQPHDRSGLGRELGDHVLTQIAGRQTVDLVQPGEALVCGDELDVGHAHAVVDDGQLIPALAERSTVDLDGAVRRREPQRVLDQLSEHVDQVDDHRTGDGGVTEAAHAHSFEVLDLAHRCSNHFAQRRRLATTTGRLRSGEDQQRLGIASHATGQVVQLEEVLQEGRVGLTLLERGDEVELTTEQRLVAAAQVGQRVGQVAPQHGLLTGEAQRGVLDVVERVGDLLHLGGTRGPQRREPLVGPAGLLGLHSLGQADQRHLFGLGGELGEGPSDRTDGGTHQEGADQDHGDQRTAGEQQHLAARGGEGVHRVDRSGGGVVAQRQQVRDPLVGADDPGVDCSLVRDGAVDAAEEELVSTARRCGECVADAVNPNREVLVGDGCRLGGLDVLRRGELRHLAVDVGDELVAFRQRPHQVTFPGTGFLGRCEQVGRRCRAVVDRSMRIEAGFADHQQRRDRRRVAVDRDQTARSALCERPCRVGSQQCTLRQRLQLAALGVRLGAKLRAGVGDRRAQGFGGRLALGEDLPLSLECVHKAERGEGHLGVAAQLRRIAGLEHRVVHRVATDGEEADEGDHEEEHESAADAHVAACRGCVVRSTCHPQPFRPDQGKG